MGVFSHFIEAAIRNIGGGSGRKLRYWYYRSVLGSCGKNVYIDTNVTFLSPGSIFLGDKVWIDCGAILMAGKSMNDDRKSDIRINTSYQFSRGELHIGDEVHIGPQVIIQAHGGCQVGNKLTIGAGSKLYTLSHHYRNTLDTSDTARYYFGSMVSPNEQFLIEAPIVIKDKAAIGINCLLFPGATIPENTWIGAGLIIKNNALIPGKVYSKQQALDAKVDEKD